MSVGRTGNEAVRLRASTASAKRPSLVSSTDDGTRKPARPFTKWAGGKTSILPQLLARVPKTYGTYFEPFVGGGALYFALRALGGEPHPAALSDMNERLVTTYRAIRDDVGEVIRLLVKLKNTEKTFYRVRAWEVDTLAPPMVAAWFIYLNKTCFNGLYRVNKSDGFNVPFANYAKPLICDADNLRAVSDALETQTTIHHLGFDAAVSSAVEGDFVYFDPPYLPVSDTSNFTAYASGGFGWAKHVELRDVALALKKRGVKVMISNCGAPRIRELYAKGFKVEDVEAPRSINSVASKRGKLVDVIIR